jgi:hypothetical protein
MADKTDDLLISVSTDLSTVKRQLKQLGDSITASTSGISKQFETMGKGIDASMTPVQRRINDMLGIPFTSKVKEWKGALADAGGEIGKTGHAAAGASTSMQAMLHSIRSMGEQLALGISPTQALTGQLSHLSYVASQPGGITGALKEVGSLAGGLITAFPYVTAAVAAAGAAFIAYEMIGGKTVATVDEALTEHAKTIKALREAYGIAGDGADDYARRSIASLESAQRRAEAALRESVAAAEKAAKSALSDSGGISGFGLLQRMGLLGDNDLNAVNAKFASFAEPINKLREQIKAGNPDFDAFQRWLDRIAASDPGRLRSVADEILGLVDKAAGGREAIDNMSVALGQLTQSQIDTGRIAAQLANIETAAMNAQGAVGALKAMLAGMSRLGEGEGSRGDAVGGKASMDRAQDSFNEQMNLWRRFGHDNDSGIDPNKPKAAAKNRRSKTPAITAADQFNNDLQAIKDRTAALAEEQAMLGKSYEAQEKRKTALQLEQTALKQVREEARKKGDADWQNAQLTPEMIGKIDAQSAAYAKQAESLRKAQEAQQEFEAWMNVGRDATRGFIDDLLSGATAGEAFANVLKKISSQLLELAMNDLFGKGGNSGFGLIGSLLGFGGGGGAFPGGGSLNSFGGLYADGGYTGSGGKNDPAGIVHKGEVVWSQDDIRKAGGLASVEGMRSRGGAMPQMPKLVYGGGGATSVTVHFAPVIDNRGASVEAVARTQQQLDRLKAEIPARVTMAVRAANKSNVKFR